MSQPAVARPVFKPEVSFQVDTQIFEERSTIVHVTVHEFTLARIWPTTFLVQDDGARKRLLQAYHIAEYPMWRYLVPGDTFTLVFEGLDRRCLLFDLFEDIPEPGALHIENIERNKSDVYRVDLETDGNY
ncbi:MAG: hypothetical protein EOO16_18595 [Chitinophagaceae bacterium]|nr:MAG: hypothetical protein EOO16_18595 [Chitinophagaceae bacterium]